MKKVVAVLLAIVMLAALVGCGQSKLTLDRVTELSAKGEALTWSDFEEYECDETGSGLYILRYDIDKNFELIIGGTSKAEAPLYIYLASKKDTDSFIDVRTADVAGFIEANTK